MSLRSWAQRDKTLENPRRPREESAVCVSGAAWTWFLLVERSCPSTRRVLPPESDGPGPQDASSIFWGGVNWYSLKSGAPVPPGISIPS